uniref:Uncharacterized protein n=1 Tax=Nicotiana tabacum TaxID=4097 RepID=A0A1S3YHH2_TOBAC|nr:PREDICTED: uncharacterized protein LOC107776337 [Nicotiana tabacum]
MLRKDTTTKWTEECQRAFDRIKEYLFNPPVLVPPELGRPLLLYMSISDNAFGCVLGQHDETGRKEQVIYYLRKKFIPYEARYTLMNPLKYIFQKPMPTGKQAKWHILLSEFDIVYVTQKAIKGQALFDHLAENPVDEEYKPLRTYFPDEEVLFAGEDILEAYSGWRIKTSFPCTNNMAEYEACILGLRMAVDMNIQELLVICDSDLLIHQELCKKFIKVDFKQVPRVQNEFADALETLTSMIQHPDKNYINPIKSQTENHGIMTLRGISRQGITLKEATITQKRTLRRLANHFFLNGKILYRRTPNLGLLRCVDAREATKLIEEIHAGTCGPHMNGFTLAKKILRAAWGMDVIRPIEPAASNGHRFILVAIDYFTKWVEASSYKPVTKKVVQIVRNNIHEKLPFALLGYRTTVRISTGATPYLMVYGTEAILPVEVEISSLRVIQEAELSNAEWRIFPHQNEAKGRFAPNWQDPYMVHRVLTGGALILAEMDGELWPKTINTDAAKRYYI